jgi:hypothetical protein
MDIVLISYTYAMPSCLSDALIGVGHVGVFIRTVTMFIPLFSFLKEDVMLGCCVQQTMNKAHTMILSKH